jgi:phage FluMu gp28-like protein
MFLPYQERWIKDESPRKYYDKARRTGITYSEAFDCTSRRFRPHKRTDRDYWFSSADESAAAEFIEYCGWFAKKLFAAIADRYVEQLEDEVSKKPATAFCVRCPNGKKIVAMTSNPRRFRSKGGDVGLDEFAFHDDPRGMYTAANPVTTWGGTLRIITTPNGEANEANKLVQKCHKTLAAMGLDPTAPQLAKPAALPAWDKLTAAARAAKISPVFSYHRTTIEDAIAQGLVEKINRVAGTSWTREAFLLDCREKALDEEAFLQEYMCVPGTDSTAWLTYALIEACEHEQCAQPGFMPGKNYAGGPCFVGVDVGRHRDITVIWVLERVGDVLWTRAVIELEKTPLPAQCAMLGIVCRMLKSVSVRIDKTGLGEGLVDYAKRDIGGDVQGVHFTNDHKQTLAVGIKQAFESRTVRIPANCSPIREDLHKVRKTTTALGTVRFEGERDKTGHADRFWALALAIGAAREGVPMGCFFKDPTSEFLGGN